MAIRELTEDQSQVVLTADNGVAMVVMVREYYKNKAQLLLADTNAYMPITKDHINRLKNKLSQTLRDIINLGGLNDHIYRKKYPTRVVAPKFYGLPQIHKIGTSLMPIVSSRGSITYRVAKELANIVSPLVGKSPL